jgi:hypothetical protein
VRDPGSEPGQQKQVRARFTAGAMHAPGARASPRTQGIRLTGVASRRVRSHRSSLARGQIERRRRPPGKLPQEIHHARARTGNGHGRGDDGRPPKAGCRSASPIDPVLAHPRGPTPRQRTGSPCSCLPYVPAGHVRTPGALFSFLFSSSSIPSTNGAYCSHRIEHRAEYEATNAWRPSGI